MKNDNCSSVTGRDVIRKAACDVGSVPIVDADRIAVAIEAMGYVCVPKLPTPEMLEAAWAEALAENAAGVWETMVGMAEGTFTIEGIPK